MQRVTYIYTGETKTFYFNFPYFEKSNIVVTVDNNPAPAYNVIGNKGGLDGDYPFTSGRIVFEKPLKKFETITIERHLPYVRPVDFQPTKPITTIALNQDMNYTMELLKDLKDGFDDLREKYNDITDKEKIETLLEKIALVNQNIYSVSEKIGEMGDIFNLSDDVNELQELLAGLNNDLTDLESTVGLINTKTSQIKDYLVDSQEPSAENNYTWYRKYNSGWVEQGGRASKEQIINLPITMSNNEYGALAGFCVTQNDNISYSVNVAAKTTTTIILKSESAVSSNEAYWCVYGYAAN